MSKAALLLAKSSEKTEQYLRDLFLRLQIPPQLSQPMQYALFAGGKRLRPALVLGCCEALGGDADAALPFAAGIEMLHTYSLIHDDLPCMDDDDMRRGKPSCHKQFGETNALLAGDALLNLAFEAPLRFANTPPQMTLACLRALATASGCEGMVAGQVLDLEAEGQVVTEEQLYQINQNKTAALLKAACEMGAICAGADAAQLSMIQTYATHLGSVFQMVDDLLDIEGDEAALGKRVGSDAKQGKTTLATLLGAEGLRKAASRQTALAKEALHPLGQKAATLCDLADFMLVRGA